MKLIENPAPTPEKNITMDEEFLVKAEAGEIGESLRFWEAKEYFVVIGRSGKAEEECRIDKCRRDGVKIIRRLSGGGTVLEGPGCLNYSVILSYERDDAFRNIRSSYRVILGGIARRLKAKGHDARFLPISDLAAAGRKFSGNAQARKKRYFLHHGTFLYDFDIEKVSRYLKHPPAEPDYRKGRAHGDFLANISESPENLMDIVKEEFLADADAVSLPGRRR